jgi:hypothetical protein
LEKVEHPLKYWTILYHIDYITKLAIKIKKEEGETYIFEVV